MSYCRFSSDSFKCDVYCYEQADGGYITHVASHKIVGDVPIIDWTSSETLYDTSKKHTAFMETAMRVPIKLPYDGQTFNDEHLSGMCRRLVELQSIGYGVPQWVIDDVLDELEEGIL